MSLDWHEDCLADAYLILGRTNEAIAEYRRVLSRYPRLALVWYHLADAYRREGMAQSAQDAMAQVLEIWKGADPNILALGRL